jgi:hypothetical protein
MSNTQLNKSASYSRLIGGLWSLVLLVAGGCVLTPAGFQAFHLDTALSELIPQDQATTIHRQILSAQVQTRRHFVRVSGRIETGGALPDSIRALAVAENFKTGVVYNRFRMNININPDGTFSKTARFKKNLKADTLQTFSIEPTGANLREGTRIVACVQVAKQRSKLATLATCRTLGLQNTLRIPAAGNFQFNDLGFHFRARSSGNLPEILGPTTGRTLVFSLRDAGRPEMTCNDEHPLSGCATVDWDDFDTGHFTNKLTVMTSAGPRDYFLTMAMGLADELDDSFEFG